MTKGRILGKIFGIALVFVVIGAMFGNLASVSNNLVFADEIVTFPDSNLEAAVREVIGKPTGDIYQSDLAELINLSAQDSGISDLTGLEYCANLKTLNLGHNEISDISPASNLTSLTELYLSGNQISDISPLAGLTSLTGLDLGDNQISDISPLSELTNLIWLRLSDNQINNVSPLSELTNLTWLWLSGNDVSDLSPISNLTNLTGLSLDANEVSDISPLSALTQLRVLYIDRNQVIDITPISAWNKLGEIEYFWWSFGWIDERDGKLIYLSLRNNQISDIQPLVQNEGLGEGDGIDLRSNPLNADSLNIYIPQLEARGVEVLYDANQPPVAGAGSDQSVSSGDLVYFDGSDSQGAIVSYEWDFGDSETATGCHVSHRFRGAMDESKTYTVTLTVRDDKGATDTDSTSITVEPQEKIIPVSPGSLEETVWMKASYNWVGVDGTSGEGIYIVSKISAYSGGLFGIIQLFITRGNGYLPTIRWHDILFTLPVEKVYVSPFSPIIGPLGVPCQITELHLPDGDFEGIEVRASDCMSLLVTATAVIPPICVDTAATTFCPISPIEPADPMLKEILDSLIGILRSPGHIIVYDSNGKVTGFVNGEIREEIPNSAYINGMVIILCPSGSHTYEVEGTDEGSYGLELISTVEGETTTVTATDIPTSGNARHEYTVDWAALAQGEPGVTIEKDSDGDGEFEETVVTTPPNTPGNPSPPNETNITAENVTLEWSGGDPDDGDTVTYDIYFGTAEDPPLVAGYQSDSTYAPSIQDHTEYHWKVVARDNHGITSEGSVWEFTVLSPCFIATAAYGTPTAEQLNILREFRDEVLLPNRVGAELVSFYYRVSPPVANFISRHEVLRTIVREGFIDPLVAIVKYSN